VNHDLRFPDQRDVEHRAAVDAFIAPVVQSHWDISLSVEGKEARKPVGGRSSARCE
jgi:hypothetical protein